jgi:signal transduction histidine kinase
MATERVSPVAASIRRIASGTDPAMPRAGRQPRSSVVPLTAAAVLMAPGVLMVGWALGGSPGAVSLLAGVLAALGVLTLIRAVAVARRSATHAERRRLVRQVLQATESERTRIASDLHDGPIQQLAVLAYSVHRVRRRMARGDRPGAEALLDELEEGLAEQVAGLRRLMTELRPPILDDSGLEQALREHVERVGGEAGITASCDVRLPHRLDRELETVLYRVAQEALTNVVKHSRAREVRVTLGVTGQSVVLTVRDDGTGFDPSRTGEFLRDGHFGLTGMRERVALLGGDFEVTSTPGQGTTLQVALANRPDSG